MGKGQAQGGQAHPLLEHDVRRQIHAAIEQKPGINWNQLRRRLDLPAGSLQHHLERLAEARLIARCHGEGDREVLHFVRADAVLGEDDQTRVLYGNEATRRVAIRLLRAPDSSARQLAQGLAIKTPAVRYHLNKLEAKDLAQRDESQRPILYRASKALEDWWTRVGESLVHDWTK